MYEMNMGGKLSVMLDHIYAVVEIPSAMSVSQVFHLFQDALSRMLFKQKPNFRRK